MSTRLQLVVSFASFYLFLLLVAGKIQCKCICPWHLYLVTDFCQQFVLYLFQATLFDDKGSRLDSLYVTADQVVQFFFFSDYQYLVAVFLYFTSKKTATCLRLHLTLIILKLYDDFVVNGLQYLCISKGDNRRAVGK